MYDNLNILLVVLESGRNSIKRALDFISQKSCLKFKVKDGNDRDWIRFIDKGRLVRLTLDSRSIIIVYQKPCRPVVRAMNLTVTECL